jgi:gliding motility-associated-like protein
MMNKCTLLTFLVLYFSISLNAKNIYVNDAVTSPSTFGMAAGSPTNTGLSALSPLSTLTDALLIAVANDIIFIDDGNYLGSANNTLSIPASMTGLQIIGAGIGQTIFTGGVTGTKNFINILAKDVTIKNMTIKNYGYGGAINVIASDAALVTKVYLENLYLYNNEKTNVDYISPSTNGNGGALWIGVDGANLPAEVYVTNCQFDRNTAEDTDGGGAIYVSENCHLIMTGSRVTCNNSLEIQAFDDGGGIYVDNANCTITKSFFSGNIAQDNDGGAIQAQNATSTRTITISECIFTKNEAKNGAAISIEDRYLVNISNSLFYDNLQRTSSFQDGGTIDIHANNTATINIVNSTIAYNRSNGGASDAAGLANSGGGTYNVKNSIIWGNASKNINAASIITTYCIIENVGNSSPASATNSFLNPLFTSTVTPDYTLLVGSPAINFGTPTGAPTTDLSNNSRTGNPDAGCFEFGSLNPAYNVSTCNALFCISPTLSVSSTYSVACFGASTGSASVVPGGGTGTYTVTWQPGNLSGSEQTGLNAGTYTVTANDGGGCPTTITLSISQPTAAVTVSLTASSASICSNSSVTLTPSGASTYTLNPGNISGNSFTVTPLTNTTYSLTGTSSSGCISTNTAVLTVSVSTSPTITILSVSNPSLCSGNNAIITPSANPTGAASYTLNPGNITGTSFTVSPSSTQIYSITGTSIAGCIGTNTAVTTITVSTTPTVSILSVSNPSICSGNNSVITPTVTPSGIISYTLRPGNLTGTSFTVSPLSNTTYSITGANAQGCVSSNTAITTITVSTTPTISILSVSNPSICSGNSTIITPTATPIGANSYTLMPGSLTGNSFTVSPLTNQTYSITGTNISGCASTNTAVTTISVSITPTTSILSVSNPTICSGNSSIITPTANPTGASNYTLSPGNLSGTSFTVSPTTNTTYSIVGINAQGCLSNNTATTAIVVNTTPTVNLNSNSTTICTGNELNLNASSLPSGGDFLWTGPNSYTSSISNPTVTTSATTLQAGTYTVTVTNTYGSETCTSAPETYSVSVVNSVLISVVSPTICFGESASILPSGASNYTVTSSSINQTGTSFTLNPTTLTTYTIVGSSGNGCDGASIFSIHVNSLPTLSVSAMPQTICSGETSTLTIAGTADTYTWSSNANNSNNASVAVSPTSSETYTVTGTENATGCSNQTSININVNTTPTVNIDASSNTICEGGSTTLNLTGATSYTLTNPSTITTNSVILTPTSQTTYTIIGETIGCVSSPTTITINVNSLPQLSSASQTICAGTTATLIANNADVYNWLPTGEITPSIIVTPTVSTTYSVSGTNTLTGCTSTINIVNVTVNALPTVTASSNPSITCSSGTVILSANTTATTYTWTLGNGITGANQNQNSINFPANTLNTGTYIYTVTVTSSDNCVSVPATTTLNIINVPNAEFNLSDLSICQNENGTISINSPQSGVTYNWTVGNESIPNSNPISVPSTITSTNGQYTVTVIASIGSCTNSASNTLTVNPLPTVSLLNPTITTCEDTEAQFDVANANSNNTYQWYYSGQNISSGISLSIKSVNESNAGTYTVTVTDLNGCIASAIGLLIIDECDTFIPEIFTPNGDGKNDWFEIKNIKKYPKNNLKIFNRWGNLVYQKDGYNNEFEGFANEGNAVGKGKLPAGTYYVVLDYGDGKTKVYNGILQLQY